MPLFTIHPLKYEVSCAALLRSDVMATRPACGPPGSRRRIVRSLLGGLGALFSDNADLLLTPTIAMSRCLCLGRYRRIPDRNRPQRQGKRSLSVFSLQVAYSFSLSQQARHILPITRAAWLKLGVPSGSSLGTSWVKTVNMNNGSSP